MPRIVVRPDAATDIRDAYRWYESVREGLGDAFPSALTETQQRIVEFPQSFSILHRETRRALLSRRFPYGLYYRYRDDMIVIVGCLHAHRNAETWQSRTETTQPD